MSLLANVLFVQILAFGQLGVRDRTTLKWLEYIARAVLSQGNRAMQRDFFYAQ